MYLNLFLFFTLGKKNNISFTLDRVLLGIGASDEYDVRYSINFMYVRTIAKSVSDEIHEKLCRVVYGCSC